jgi:23S rRNA pseudouridine1911/1915/1917 synthase
LGHPLVGDTTYGARQNKRLEELTGYVAPRQMLHAGEISFVHPATGMRCQLRAPLPEDFLAALEALRGDPL